MSRILDSVLDDERRAQCQCHDEAMEQAFPTHAQPSVEALWRAAMTKIVVLAVVLAFGAGHMVGATSCPKVKFVERVKADPARIVRL